MSESKKSAEQVEQERLTRRQALRKFGFGAGLSAIMLLGADELARMVGDRMRQMEGDNRAANQIAKEFRGAGIALADGPIETYSCPDGIAPEPNVSQRKNTSRGGVIAFDVPGVPPDWAIGVCCHGNVHAYGAATTCADCCTNGCNHYYTPGLYSWFVGGD